MSSPAWAAECLEIPGDDRCEAWVAERAYGDIWGGFLQEQAARNLVALDDLLLVAEPVNDPGAQRFEERYDFELAAFATADGSVRWTRRYGGPDGAWDIPYSVALSPDERVVYVTGMRDYPRTPNIIDIGGGCTEEFHPASAITLAYTVADGALLWASGLDEEPSLDATFGSALSPGGETLYVAGARAGSSDEECDIDFAVAALDTATGREIWRTVLPGAPGRFDQAMTVVVTPDGATLVATGVTSTANRGADYLTIGLDLPDQGEPPAVVSLDWQSTYHGGSGNDSPRGMVMAPDGRTVFITGQSEHAGSSQLFVPREYATVAYDTATGGQRWVARYRGGEDGVTTPKGIAIDPEGTRVFVTGQSVGDTEATWDYGTVAYDASTGARLWAHSYPDLPAQGRGFDVAVGHDGRRVYVTGETNNDAATLAYDAANGSVMWTARFNPTVAGYDAAGARRIVLSPNGGRLFVIGSATNRIDSIRWQQGLYDGDLDRGYVWAYDL